MIIIGSRMYSPNNRYSNSPRTILFPYHCQSGHITSCNFLKTAAEGGWRRGGEGIGREGGGGGEGRGWLPGDDNWRGHDAKLKAKPDLRDVDFRFISSKKIREVKARLAAGE